MLVRKVRSRKAVSPRGKDSVVVRRREGSIGGEIDAMGERQETFKAASSAGKRAGLSRKGGETCCREKPGPSAAFPRGSEE